MKASSFNGRRQCQEDDRAIEVGQETVVKLLYPRCGILVVQGQRVLACVRIQDEGGPAHDEVRTFAMQPAELAMLSDWLAAHNVTYVAIDSPNPPRQTLFQALQPAFTALEIEAGRVTDDGDIGRIASLLAYGLETCRVVPPPSPQESAPRQRRQLITVSAVIITVLLASYWLWTYPGLMYSESLPAPTPVRMVQWHPSSVSYQHPGGQLFFLPLPTLERSPEGLPVEVALDATSARPGWLLFDRERLSLRGTTPILTEAQTYQLVIRAQTEQGNPSFLYVSLTITGQPEVTQSPASTRAAAEGPAVSIEVPPPPPFHVGAPLPADPSIDQAQLLTILSKEPPHSTMPTNTSVPATSQVAEPLPSMTPLEETQLLKILSGDPPSSSVPPEALPLPSPRVPESFPTDRPVDQDCLRRILAGEPCAGGL